jgi:alkylation response protein AidB-like acyl-CoA dehydrogenase
MSPPSSSLDHPAFARTPAWVQQKLSPKAIDIIKKVHHWVENECVPAEPIVKRQLEKHGRWKMAPLIRELREKAKQEGLFNLFLPKTFGSLSPGLTNLEYSCCCELLGRVYWAAMVSKRVDRSTIQLLIVALDSELPCSRHWQHGTNGKVL